MFIVTWYFRNSNNQPLSEPTLIEAPHALAALSIYCKTYYVSANDRLTVREKV
jgi:hypothetical protein